MSAFKQGLIRVEIRDANAAGQVQIGLLCTGGDGRGFWTLPKDIVDASMVQIARRHAEDSIPVDWIRQQAEEFPGMESAMWGKLIRLWKKKIACEELYGGDNEDD